MPVFGDAGPACSRLRRLVPWRGVWGGGALELRAGVGGGGACGGFGRRGPGVCAAGEVGSVGGRLEGRVAVVTGGGGGLAEGICARLARDGAAVACADVSQEKAERVAGQVAA